MSQSHKKATSEASAAAAPAQTAHKLKDVLELTVTGRENPFDSGSSLEKRVAQVADPSRGAWTGIQGSRASTNANTSAVRERYTASLQSLFGLPEDVLAQYPTAGAFCRYVETCFEPLLAEEYASVWDSLAVSGRTTTTTTATATGSTPQQPRTVADCWPLFDAVCSALRGLKDESSVEDVWVALCPPCAPAADPAASIHDRHGRNNSDGDTNKASISKESRHLGTTKAVPRSMQRSSPSSSQNAYLVAIFSVLCWATMTLPPKLDWKADFNGAAPSLMVDRPPFQQDGLRLESVKERPIPALFRQFHRTMVTTRWKHPIGDANANNSSTKASNAACSPTSATSATALEVSCLNYASLRDIAKIRLVWSSDLTSHLDFDATKRELSIFRFPTFCMLNALAEEESAAVPVLVGLFRGLYGASLDATTRESHGSAQLHQEVIMSYRLLFAQTRGSIKLVKPELRACKAAVAKRRTKVRGTEGSEVTRKGTGGGGGGVADDESEGNDYDSMLDLLCTRRFDKKIRSLPEALWPVTCRSFDGHLQEESSYSAQDDFPFLGQRLAKLQEFTLRQQPSELLDLWRDRRNPLQWYTFWAVLVVGGISILLGVLQFAVALGQLIISLRGSGRSC